MSYEEANSCLQIQKTILKVKFLEWFYFNLIRKKTFIRTKTSTEGLSYDYAEKLRLFNGYTHKIFKYSDGSKSREPRGNCHVPSLLSSHSERSKLLTIRRRSLWCRDKRAWVMEDHTPINSAPSYDAKTTQE